MIRVIVCKGCFTAYQLPKSVDGWQVCACGCDEYSHGVRESAADFDVFVNASAQPTGVDMAPDREPWEDREDRDRVELMNKSTVDWLKRRDAPKVYLDESAWRADAQKPKK